MTVCAWLGWSCARVVKQFRAVSGNCEHVLNLTDPAICKGKALGWHIIIGQSRN